MIERLSSEQKDLLMYIFAVLIIAASTYVFNYYNPSAVFWDENYHIASAQKYIDGVMYMEPHPPLGKLFIALGEVILHPNDAIDTAYFLDTDYIKKFPKDYSFVGMRLFPTLFGGAASALFFLILYRFSRQMQLSFLFTSMYLFANAFILQSRSAMLESTQMFFIFATILWFAVLFDRDKKGYKDYLILGVLVGLSTAVKLNGLILILLYPFLYFYNLDKASIFLHVREFILKGLTVAVGIIAVFTVVFYIHFILADTMGVKSYKASAEYKQILKDKATADISNFPIMIKDNIRYIREYSKTVPRYNPCKKVENGSLAATWPFGNKSINYRWGKKDGKVSYLYLQINPMIWFSVVAAMIIAFAMIISKFIFGLHVKDRRLFYLIATFSGMYASYMITMFNIERVMYLYHYFIALFFGVFVLFLLLNYLFKEAIEKESKIFYIAVVIFVLEIIYCYYYFAPFTYFKPLTTMEFFDRQWFDFWKLKPIL
jgi:dolichyl-phosphate-mannose--protein O-mannosyl transferase